MIVINGYIIAVEKTDNNFKELTAKIADKPTEPQGYQYKLRADTLEWELVELPPEPEPGDEEAGEEDYVQVLNDLGVRLS